MDSAMVLHIALELIRATTVHRSTAVYQAKAPKLNFPS